MNLIKNRLRNSLTTTLLDDLMMINLNGPKLNTPEMSQLLDRVYDRWINIRARNVKMSHRESRVRVKEPTEHSKDIDSTVDEELQPLQPDMEDSADNNVVYITAPGFAAIAALDEQSFKDLIGFRFRKAGTLVSVAYKFDNGWQTGKWESVSDRATRAEVVLSEPAFPVHIVNFSKVRHQLQLSLASYGIDGKWCLVCEDECNYEEQSVQS